MLKPKPLIAKDLSRRYVAVNTKASQDKLVTNDVSKRKRVLTELKHALNEANTFDSAVAFVTKSGVMSLFQALTDFTARGGKVRLVASDYLSFTQPEALSTLLKIKGVELRLLEGANYHGKLYLFQSPTLNKVLVGSSNLTQAALSKNEEINFLFTDGDARVQEANEEFRRIWQAASVLSDKVLANYTERYTANKLKAINHVVQLTSFTPNALQKSALESLTQSRALGKTRGLVVSATGTGKTVLSAFDVRQTKAKSALFLVHRTTIAKKSLETYRAILKGQYSFGLVGSKSNQWDADFLFGTVQTLSRPQNLAKLDKKRFDYIVIDETHRASAASYQRVIEHFEPKFLLGMTATPERTDDQNIFEVFDNNIVCDIRLQDALATDILCPFHYFGIADFTYKEEVEHTNLSITDLTDVRRFKHILEQSMLLGTDASAVKALCFVSRVEEAEAFAKYLTSNGRSAKALSGNSSETEKQDAISALENGTLEFIVTVDIFNEGVDIPSVNQIIMARPTQSAIVFVQQLGRGLRKHDNKEYLTVIDIVGNYDNNFLIPIALYGDRTRNKDTLRRLLRSEETLLPGESTISFDQIAKERIFRAIQTSRNIGIKELKAEYNVVKAKIGKAPLLMDIRKHGELSPLSFCKHSTLKSLHQFACKYDADYDYETTGQFPLLGVLLNEALDGVSGVEPAALRLLLSVGNLEFNQFRDLCEQHYGILPSIEQFKATVNLLSLNYDAKPAYKDYCVIETSSYKIGRSLQLLNQAQKRLLTDAIDNADAEYATRRSIGRYCHGFVVGAKYTYKETFRILGWKKNPNPQNVGGYFLQRETNDCAIFVNYHKGDSISETTQYEDYFIDRTRFHWTTKSGRTFNSPEVKAILNQANSQLRIPLFIRKEAESEGSARYYIGELKAIVGSQQAVKVGGKNAVSIEFELDQAVPQKLYNHLIQ